jgi:hypothetical protein
VGGTYYSVRKEEKWLVHCKIGRRRGTYDLIVDMIAIHQLPTFQSVDYGEIEEGRTWGAGG